MHLETTTAPVGDIISLQEAKEHLNLEHTGDDDLVETIVADVTARYDGITGIMGRALRTQTVVLYLDAWPSEIMLPLPPFQSITSVTYTDSDGNSQTLAADQYRTTMRNGVTYIIPAYNVTWPTVRGDTDCIQITWVCGYGSKAVPGPIKRAMLLEVGDAYEHRETVVVGTTIGKNEMAIKNLITPYRVVEF